MPAAPKHLTGPHAWRNSQALTWVRHAFHMCWSVVLCVRGSKGGFSSSCCCSAEWSTVWVEGPVTQPVVPPRSGHLTPSAALAQLQPHLFISPLLLPDSPLPSFLPSPFYLLFPLPGVSTQISYHLEYGHQPVQQNVSILFCYLLSLFVVKFHFAHTSVYCQCCC